jgi:glycosyltransferase involved in cell wall biosynthesis
MKVGINLLYLVPDVVGGTEVHARGLLNAMAEAAPDFEFVVYLNRRAADWHLPAANMERVVCSVDGGAASARYAFEQMALPSLLRKHAVSLVHSFGYVSPLRTPCPALVTIHDLNYLAFGEQMPWARRSALRFFVARSARAAARVFAVSEFTRREIIERLGVPENRVRVIHNACSPRDWRGKTGADVVSGAPRDEARPYIIAFSSSTPNKNLPRLIEAFLRLRARERLPHQLKLVGHVPSALARWAGDGPGDGDSVRFTGHLPDAEVVRLLAGAEMLVFPSLYEGFGLPVLEAMDAGVPVACSRAAAIPEVAGDAAAYFSPTSVDDIAETIGRVLSDPTLQKQLRSRGRRNLERFSWQRSASLVLEEYRNIARASGRLAHNASTERVA